MLLMIRLHRPHYHGQLIGEVDAHGHWREPAQHEPPLARARANPEMVPVGAAHVRPRAAVRPCALRDLRRAIPGVSITPDRCADTVPTSQRSGSSGAGCRTYLPCVALGISALSAHRYSSRLQMRANFSRNGIQTDLEVAQKLHNRRSVYRNMSKLYISYIRTYTM